MSKLKGYQSFNTDLTILLKESKYSKLTNIPIETLVYAIIKFLQFFTRTWLEVEQVTDRTYTNKKKEK